MIPSHVPSRVDEFIILKELGSGGQAIVKLGQLNGDLFAIKLYRSDSSMTFSSLQKQIKIMQSLNHPNIVKGYGVRDNAIYQTAAGEKTPYIATIMEYCNAREIYDYLVTLKRFQVPAARAFFRSMLSAVEHMHDNGITHRDLKPENILIDLDCNIKIIDFGLAASLTAYEFEDSVGSVPYMAPQVHHRKYRGDQADLFALGVILFCLVTGFPPFPRANILTDKHYSALNNTPQIYWTSFVKKRLGNEAQYRASASFIDLMTRMLSLNPEKRLTIKQLKGHAWVNQETYSQEQIQQIFYTKHAKANQEKEKTIKRNIEEREQRKKQGEKGERSGHTDNYDEILQRIQLDPESLKTQTEIYPSDYIIEETPVEFLVELYEFLCYKENNLLLEECEEELFVIETGEKSDEVTIELGYNDFGGEFKVKVSLRLSKTPDDKLKIEFFREPKDDSLMSYRLINLLKDQFEYLKTQNLQNK